MLDHYNGNEATGCCFPIKICSSRWIPSGNLTNLVAWRVFETLPDWCSKIWIELPWRINKSVYFVIFQEISVREFSHLIKWYETDLITKKLFNKWFIRWWIWYYWYFGWCSFRIIVWLSLMNPFSEEVYSKRFGHLVDRLMILDDLMCI